MLSCSHLLFCTPQDTYVVFLTASVQIRLRNTNPYEAQEKKLCASLQDLIIAALSINPSVRKLQIFQTSLTSYFQHNLVITNTSARTTSVRVTVSCNEGCFHCHKTQLQIFTVISTCRVVLKMIKKIRYNENYVRHYVYYYYYHHHHHYCSSCHMNME